MSPPRRLDWLGERSRPHYGQLVLTVSLLAALALTFRTWNRYPGERLGPATVASFLPAAVFRWEALYVGCFAAFVVGGALWLLRRGVPWSSWAAALGFTGLLIFYRENADHVDHTRHVTNVVLLIHALWYHFYRREIRDAVARGDFWATPLYPRWVYSLCVFYVGCFYGISGLNKLRVSGFDWPNGVSLQLWVNLWGDPDCVWTRLVLSDRRLAVLLQWGTLAAEVGGLVAVVSPRLRPWVGLGLLGLHYGIVTVFGWGFHANAVIVALVFLPFREWVERFVAWRETALSFSGEKNERRALPVRGYFEYLATERSLSGASCRVFLHGIRFLYLQVLERPSFNVEIPIPKKAQRIPELLTRAEVGRILNACTNPKHRMMLTLCYGCGLRLSELVSLKVRDINGERQLLRIEQGKGAKDRLVPLSETLLAQLRAYWRLYRPREWLFPGHLLTDTLSETSVQKAFTHAKARAGVKKIGGIASLARQAGPSLGLAFIGSRRQVSGQFGVLGEYRPRGRVGSGAEPDGIGDRWGSGQLESIEGPRRCSGRWTGGQAEHGGGFDGGDDLQRAAAVRAFFDIEHPLSSRAQLMRAGAECGGQAQEQGSAWAHPPHSLSVGPGSGHQAVGKPALEQSGGVQRCLIGLDARAQPLANLAEGRAPAGGVEGVGFARLE